MRHVPRLQRKGFSRSGQSGNSRRATSTSSASTRHPSVRFMWDPGWLFGGRQARRRRRPAWRSPSRLRNGWTSPCRDGRRDWALDVDDAYESRRAAAARWSAIPCSTPSSSPARAPVRDRTRRGGRTRWRRSVHRHLDSTATLARLGDKAWRVLLDHNDALRGRLDQFRGREIGDRRRIGPQRRRGSSRPLCRRDDRRGPAARRRDRAVHTGEVDMLQRANARAAFAVHAASRVAALAGPGESPRVRVRTVTCSKMGPACGSRTAGLTSSKASRASVEVCTRAAVTGHPPCGSHWKADRDSTANIISQSRISSPPTPTRPDGVRASRVKAPQGALRLTPAWDRRPLGRHEHPRDPTASRT